MPASDASSPNARWRGRSACTWKIWRAPGNSAAFDSRLRERPAAVSELPLAARTGAAGARRHRSAAAARMARRAVPATNSKRSRCGANWRRCAGCSSSCCAKAWCRSMWRAWCARRRRRKKLPEVMSAEQANTLLDGVAARQTRAPVPGARPRHFRAALRLRPAGERTGGPGSGRYRPVRGLAAGARQGQKGAPGASAREGGRSAGALPRRNARSCAKSAPSF